MKNAFPDIKQVCIYGTGGVGGYFGGKIAEVFNNSPQFKDYEIYFIAQGRAPPGDKTTRHRRENSRLYYFCQTHSGHRQYPRYSISGFNFTLYEKL